MSFRDIMITIHQVEKKYKRNIVNGGSYQSFRDIFTINFWKQKKRQEEFFALKNINIQIKEGEKVGIIGPNGSGKSTLLKIISRVTPPTDGFVELNGRVASLLEVGTGFHPELTGKENIYLNGAILGMSRQEIKKNLEKIIEFSEIEAFIDTPVKHYSSGMFVRLAFSVASHLSSDILILDEVLAVGDHRFQEKCFGKMKEITNSKKTVLFVSHNMGAIQNFCEKVIVINKGQIQYQGSVAKGIEHYLNLNQKYVNNKFVLEKKSNAISLEITQAWIATAESNKDIHEVKIGCPFYLWYEYEIKKVVHNCVIALLLSREGMPILYHYDSDSIPERAAQREPGFYKDKILINSEDLKEGYYEIALLVGYGQDNITNPNCRIHFNIINTELDFTNKGCRYDRPGCLRKQLAWETVEFNRLSKKEALA